MKRALRLFSGLGLLAGLAGCPFDDGGGGGGGSVNFSQGFAFIRKDDHNVYIADQSDFTQVQRLTTAGNARHPSLSRDGRSVVYVRAFAGDTEVFTVPTTGAIPPTRILATSTTMRNFRHPVFSPDGKRIVFAFDDTGSALGVVNADGSGFSKLAGSGSLSYASPSFFPDGQAVLAIAGSAGGFTQLEKVTLAGQTSSVTNDLGPDASFIVNRAVLSPDGSRAAFDGRLAAGGARIFVVNLATRAVTQLTDYPSEPTASDSFPCWVGVDRVGFSSDFGGNDAVYALGANSTKTSGGLQMASAVEPWYGPNP